MRNTQFLQVDDPCCVLEKTFDQVVPCSIWDVDHMLTPDIILKNSEGKI